MTRVTAPISKLAHSLASKPSVARPGYIASHAGKAISSHRAHLELKSDGRSSDSVDSSRSITTTHRPTAAPTPSPYRIIPLMQTFRTSSPASASASASSSPINTIDAAVLPDLFSLASSSEPAPPAVRVPLLPDNFSPDRAVLQAQGHLPEVPDAPLAAPEITIVAAHPENVAPAALTEIEGMGVDGVELRFVHDAFAPASSSSSSADSPQGDEFGSHGMLRDLWKGLVDDVFGEAGGKKPSL